MVAKDLLPLFFFFTNDLMCYFFIFQEIEIFLSAKKVELVKPQAKVRNALNDGGRRRRSSESMPSETELEMRSV